MRELVILPTFQRPEMLTVCCEAIRASEPDIPLHIFPDRGTDERSIATKFNAIHHLTWQHSYHGNSSNMLEALKWAYGQGAETVYIIEDDAIIDRSFFDWSREALKNPPFGEQPFAACGWRYSPDTIPHDGPDQLMAWYLSVCAALPRRSLTGIIQHARPDYYADMRGYLDRTYPNSHRRRSNHYEQDGLILRVCESETKRCVWPRRPRAIHVGWRGYHQTEGQEAPGTLAQKVEIVKLAVKNPQLLNGLMNGAAPPEMGECGECRRPLFVDNKKARTVCVACYHAAHPGLPVTSNSHYYLTTQF